MRYQALAVDYDGTIAREGCVDDATRAALRRLKASGRRLLLVTGRELTDLAGVCDDLSLFDLLVVENGAVLHDPVARASAVLCEPPPAAFVAELARWGIEGVTVGQAIVAMPASFASLVLEVIRDCGLPFHVVFNRGALMVLPAGVHKGTGLAAALARLGVHPAHAVAIGDAENDHPMLALCGYGAAVANALPALKARAQVVTRGEGGEGVAELIDRLIAFDLPDRNPFDAPWLPVSPSPPGRPRAHDS